MKFFVNALIKNKRSILLVFIFTCLYGIYSFTVIPKKEFPNTAMPLVNLIVTAPGYTASQVESEILPKINTAIEPINDVTNIYQYSFANVGTTLLEFDLAVTDVRPYMDQISKNLEEVNFEDENISYEVSSDFKESQVVYALTGTNQQEVSTEIAAELSLIDGIDNVKISPDYEQQYELVIDVDKLSKLNIDFETFNQILAAQAMDIPLGYINEKDGAYPIITANNLEDKDAILNMVVGINPMTNEQIKVSDVSTVNVVNTSNNLYEVNDKTATLIEVYFEDNLDYTQVGIDIRDVVDNYVSDLDYEINELVFQPDDVKKSIDSIFINLLQAIFLVIIVVFIGLGLRSSILISFTFPFTILATIGILNTLGQDLQKISIAGLIISIGIIVDNAIVINDAIVYNLDRKMERLDAIYDAMRANFIPVLTSTATTIAAFSPLLFLTGVAGTITFSLPVTVIISLILSFVMSMVITPLLAYYFLKPSKPKKIKQSKFSVEKIIRKTVTNSKTVIISTIGLVVVLFLSVLFVPIIIFPSAEKSIIYVEYTNNESSEFDDTVNLSHEIVDFIKTQDYLVNDVENYSSIVGGQMPQFYSTLPTFPLNQNQGYIYLDMDSTVDVTDMKNKLDETLNQEFSSRINISANEVELNTPTSPITMVLKGNDLDVINSYSQQLQSDIASIDGVLQVKGSSLLKTPLYEVVVNEDYLLQNGLTPVQVQSEIAKILNGSELSLINQEGVSDQLLINTDVKSKEDLLATNYVINSKSYLGSDLFTIDETSSYESFYNQDFSNAMTISVDLKDGYSVYEVQKSVKEYINNNTPESVTVELGGEAELAADVFGGVAIAAIVALLAIFIILLLQFNSFKNSIIVLLSVPLSISGSLLALFVFNTPLTFTVGLGLTSLLGIVVNNGILLVSYIEEYKKSDEPLIEVCVMAVTRRFRPIMISNITTIIGLTPLIISGGDFFQPMAISLAGGLFIGTILTIIFVPCIYFVTNKNTN